MSDADLRAALEAWVRRRYEGALDRHRSRLNEEASLSDAEWLSRHTGRIGPLDDAMTQRLLQYRHQQSPQIDEDAVQQLVEKEVARIWPCLLEIREEQGEDGPVTEEQLTAASQRASEASIEQTSERIREATASHPDRRRREVMANLSEMIEADQPDLQRLRGPDVTEETPREATSRMSTRIYDLAIWLRNRREG